MQSQQHLSLRRNFSWTFIGNGVYAASQWGMLVILAKLGSPEMVGQFTLALAVTAPVEKLTNLNLRSVQVTDAKRQYLFADYLGIRLITAFVTTAIVVGIIICAGYRWETSLVILVIGMAKSIESISDILYGLIQQHERMELIAVSLMLKGLLSLCLLSLGVYCTGSVLWGTIGLAAAWLIVLLICDLRNGVLILSHDPMGANLRRFSTTNYAMLKPKWHLRTVVSLVWLALPLGCVLMLMSLNVSIPRFFIEQHLGERELGIFSALAYPALAGGMIVNALAESASPRLAKYYALGNLSGFKLLLAKLLGIGTILGIGTVLVAILWGKPLLTLIYQPEYGARADLFIWLMVVAAITYIASFLGYGMNAARYFRIQMPLFAIVTSVAAVSCLWLVPAYGLQGAAMSLLIAAMVQVLCSLGVITRGLFMLQKGQRSEQLAKDLACLNAEPQDQD